MVGGLVGAFSGAVLGRRERVTMRTNANRRCTAFTTSAAPFVVLAGWAKLTTDGDLVASWLVCSLLSGTAGAVLAIRVLKPWNPHPPGALLARRLLWSWSAHPCRATTPLGFISESVGGGARPDHRLPEPRGPGRDGVDASRRPPVPARRR